RTSENQGSGSAAADPSWFLVSSHRHSVNSAGNELKDKQAAQQTIMKSEWGSKSGTGQRPCGSSSATKPPIGTSHCRPPQCSDLKMISSASWFPRLSCPPLTAADTSARLCTWPPRGPRLMLLSLLLLGKVPGPQPGSAFYLPDLAPVDFFTQEKSDECKAEIELVSPESKHPSENQVLFKERIEPSPYKFTFNKSEACKIVCTKTYHTEKAEDKQKLDFLKKKRVSTPEFPIGCYITAEGHAKDACVTSSEFSQRDTFYISNHVDIKIYYHVETGSMGARLVAAKLEPKSIKHTHIDKPDCYGPPPPWINWKASGGHLDGTIFWRLCLIPTLIGLRGCPEEFDWRLVHGDLFRPPRKGMLSVFLVFGTQILIMTFGLRLRNSLQLQMEEGLRHYVGPDDHVPSVERWGLFI
ncbi:hypothetical protein U0070_003492, partial [Myodes glareolus]